MKAVLNNAIKYLVNTDSRFKRVVKSIYFMMPFGFLYCLFFSKRFKNRIDLILGLKYYYNLNGLDYIDPNLNMRFSKMHLWGGYFTKNKISFYFNLNDISKVVDILDDEYSKNLYLSAICNYVSKTQGFLISLYYGNIWKYYYLLAKAKTSHKITINYFDYFLYDLSLINLAPLKLYYSQLGIFADFYLEQYSYKHIIKANAGDFVIDGGACYGDTALYFSNLVGESGKVFAFEFVSENIEIFNKNLSLNPHISNIKLIKSPLYKDSDTFVSSDGVGGSARLDHSSCNIKTISIDDFIQKEGVVKIDFIKLDIEGSELDALKGAINCIKKFKPKLAICLYHSAKDYSEIPLFLHSIMPEYKFYFDHFTLGRYESVLFAI